MEFVAHGVHSIHQVPDSEVEWTRIQQSAKEIESKKKKKGRTNF